MSMLVVFHHHLRTRDVSAGHRLVLIRVQSLLLHNPCCASEWVGEVRERDEGKGPGLEGGRERGAEDGRMGGWEDGRMGGWMDGWMDG
eukprot:292077-Rhodomonas_salina.1